MATCIIYFTEEQQVYVADTAREYKLTIDRWCTPFHCHPLTGQLQVQGQTHSGTASYSLSLNKDNEAIGKVHKTAHVTL